MHGRPKGSADYYLPLPVLSSYLILSWASDPKGTMSYKTEGKNFHPSMGRKGLGGDWALGGWGPGAKRGVLGRLAATLQPSVVYDSQKLWVLWLRVVLGLFFWTLREGTWGCPRSLRHGQSPPCCFISSQRLCHNIWTFYLKNFGFYAVGLFRAALGWFWDP